MPLRQTPEGYPYIEGPEESPAAPPIPDTDYQIPELSEPDYAEQARQMAAERIRQSVTQRSTAETNFNRFGEELIKGIQEGPKEAIKSWYEATEGRYYPPNAKFITEEGVFLDENQQPIPQQRKPDVLPVTKDPTTGEIQPAMPGMLDVWQTTGSPAGTLGAGPIFRNLRPPPGIGHNQGPPLGPTPPLGPPHPPPPGAGGVPPPPPTAPPGLVPPAPRRIVYGHSPDERLTYNNLRTKTIDNLHPLKVLQNRIAESGALSPQEQFYELARLTRGSYGRTRQALENATFDFNTLANNGISLKKVLNPVKDDLQDFERFAVAARDVELINRGINTGTTLTDAQNIVNAAPAHYRQSLQNLHLFQRRILQYIKDAGIISDEAFNAITAANQHYVPFHRLMDSKEIQASSRNIRTGDPIRRIIGSSRDILSPIETIIKNTHYFIDLAEKNRALNALVDSANARGLTGLVEKVRRPVHPVNVHQSEIEKFFRDNNIPIPPELYGAPDRFAVFRQNALRPADDEIAVWKNGKPQLYKVDPEVANAVNGMGRQEVDFIMKLVSLPARGLRAGVVLGPEFLMKNPARDQIVATIMSEHGYLPVFSFIRGLGHMMGRSAAYQNFLKGGGANSALVNMDRRYMQEQIRIMMETGWWDKVKNNVRHPIEFMSKVSDYLEQPTRVGEAVAAQKRGKTIHQSAMAGREVSVDFGVYGSSKLMQMMSQSTSFFNPQIQGVDKLARQLGDSKTRSATLWKIGAAVVAPTLLAYAYNRQDPRMKDIPRWERDLFWHIPTDDWRPINNEQADSIPDRYKKFENDQWFANLGTILRFPKPFEIGMVFGSAIERSLDLWFDKDPEQFKEFNKSVRSAFLPSFVPQAAGPMLEQLSGHNFFREKPIVPKRVESPANRKYEYTPFTSETAKYIGGLISNISPETGFSSPLVIENYVRGWAGTLGSYALKLSDKIIKGVQGAGGKEIPPEAESTWADIPGIKAFVSRMPTTQAATIQDFYDNLEKTRGTKRLVKRMGANPFAASEEEAGQDVDKILNEQVNMNMGRTATAIGKMMRQIEIVQGAKDMTPGDKRKAIEMLTLGAIQAAEAANNAYYEERRNLVKPKAGP